MSAGLGQSGIDGTQAIRRAAEILQRIAQNASGKGPSSADISASLGLSRSTVHRMLKCLVDVRLASYDQRARVYQIGPLSYELGLAVTDGVLEMARYRGFVDRISRRTGVTAYLMRRSGVEAVCMHKADGNSVVRVIPVEVGQRRFLGVGAGATALLAALDDATVDRIIAVVEGGLERHRPLTAASVRAAVDETRRVGVAMSRGQVFDSVFGMGVALPQTQESQMLAFSIAAHMSEVDEAKTTQWREILLEEREAAAKGLMSEG